MAERALAHIERIEWIKPIEGADNIELIGVLGWVCIAKIGEFHVGDKCIYIEIDSLVNKDDERFKFLESKNYKIKTMKLGKFKVISQGLALPITEFPEVANCNIGDDVTEKLKVTYYNPDDVQRKKNPIKDKNAKYNSMIARHKKLFSHWPYNKLIRKEWGRKFLFVFFGQKKDNPKGFPEWIKKTDEVRIEGIPWILDQDKVWIQTEKCLSYRMSIRTDDGYHSIADIVNHKLPVRVATYNFDRGVVEYQPILEYHRIEQNDNMPHYKIGVGHRGKGNRPKYIECTANHKFYVNGEWKSAEQLSVGDNVSHYCEKMPREAFEMIIGSLLGDASINNHGNYFNIGFGHCIDQIEYLNYKRSILGIYAMTDQARISGYGTEMHSFVTASNLFIDKYVSNNCLDENRKKIVTQQWCDDMTPISLAFWYMDDGTLKNREDERLGERISLATNALSYDECKLLTDMLSSRFNVDATICFGDSYKGNVIEIGVDGTQRFCSLIAPYVCESMKYKLPKRYESMRCVFDGFIPQYDSGIVETQVLSVERKSPMEYGHYMYDITTQNHNYFAQSILVHNCDGTSCTYAVDEGKRGKYEFIVCSRNVRQQSEDDVNYNTKESGTNVYWEMAHKYDIQNKLEQLASCGYKRVVLQGECIGEGIQGNPYKLQGRDFYVFNLIVDGNRLPSVEAAQWCKTNGLKHVPIISDCHELPKTMEEMKLEADGFSVINPKVKREGFVYRSQDGLQSFKNVSREYLLKHS